MNNFLEHKYIVCKDLVGLKKLMDVLNYRISVFHNTYDCLILLNRNLQKKIKDLNPGDNYPLVLFKDNDCWDFSLGLEIENFSEITVDELDSLKNENNGTRRTINNNNISYIEWIDFIYSVEIHFLSGSNLYINFKNENEYDEFYDNIMTKTTFSF